MIRALVVDDSPTVQQLLVYILGSDPEIKVVGCASNGEQAVRLVRELKPDVITMDLHMPNMNGLEATRAIMQSNPTPIVIVSGSQDNDEIVCSFRAIEAGALVVVQRPFGVGCAAHHETSNALIRAVKSMSEVRVVRRWPVEPKQNSIAPTEAAAAAHAMPKLAVMGASTGGPAVLREILAQLAPPFALPIVIVQHMSPGFVTGFASWLSSASQYPVELAEHGMPLRAGCAYLAPDAMQIGVTDDLRAMLLRLPSEHGMCPSVSHLFRSISPELCRGTVAVLLTGMGKDGAVELRRMKDYGAFTVVQDRTTSAVFGMPGEAIRHDAARMILPPPEIANCMKMFAAQKMTFLP